MMGGMTSPKARKPSWTVAMDRLAHDQAVLRWIAVVGGVLAIAISFPQLRWVYQDFIGLPVWAAYAVPLMIDLLAVMFAGIVGTTVGASRPARVYAWAGLGFFVAVSIAGNAMHAWWHQTGDYLPAALTAGTGWVILMFAAMPPIGATLGIHGRSFLDRSGVDADRAAVAPDAPTAPRATAQPAAQPAARKPAPTPRAPARTPRAADWRERAAQLHADTGDRTHGWKARIRATLTAEGHTLPHRSNVDRYLDELEQATADVFAPDPIAEQATADQARAPRQVA